MVELYLCLKALAEQMEVCFIQPQRGSVFESSTKVKQVVLMTSTLRFEDYELVVARCHS